MIYQHFLVFIVFTRGVAKNSGLGVQGSNRDLFSYDKYESDIKESNVSSSC